MAITKDSGSHNIEDTGAKILDRLQAALRSDGDFPVRAKVVADLRIKASQPTSTVDQVADLILREPTLGTRILHIVNSAYYQRAKPVVTISQAVIRLGMTAISDLCAGLVLMQKFVPAAKRGGIFADCVKRNIVTALLSNEIARRSRDHEVAEKGYLAGTFYHLGHLLLAYYFPQVYEAAGKRAEARGYDISRSLAELLGRSPADLVLAIVDALRIPDVYREVLVAATSGTDIESEDSTLVELARALRVAGLLSEAIVDGRTRERLEHDIRTLAQLPGMSESLLVETIQHLPEAFKQHCQFIELGFLSLPEYLNNFVLEAAQPTPRTPEAPPQDNKPDPNSFESQLAEIREAVESGEPLSSIVALVMEMLAGPLHYDRVLLLEVDTEQQGLVGKMSLGEWSSEDPRSLTRAFHDVGEDAPDLDAFKKGLPVIFGTPLFPDGWPFAAIPIGAAGACKGVVYADRLDRGAEAEPLDGPAQAALTVLTEIMESAVQRSEDW